MKELEGQDPRLIQILEKMLEFNPYFRWSAAECLNSTYFDDIRNPSLEKYASKKLILEIDQDDAFNYQTGESSKFTRQSYLEIIYKNA